MSDFKIDCLYFQQKQDYETAAKLVPKTYAKLITTSTPGTKRDISLHRRERVHTCVPIYCVLLIHYFE